MSKTKSSSENILEINYKNSLENLEISKKIVLNAKANVKESKNLLNKKNKLKIGGSANNSTSTLYTLNYDTIDKFSTNFKSNYDSTTSDLKIYLAVKNGDPTSDQYITTLYPAHVVPKKFGTKSTLQTFNNKRNKLSILSNTSSLASSYTMVATDSNNKPYYIDTILQYIIDYQQTNNYKSKTNSNKYKIQFINNITGNSDGSFKPVYVSVMYKTKSLCIVNKILGNNKINITIIDPTTHQPSTSSIDVNYADIFLQYSV
jgi:hypothetical protein